MILRRFFIKKNDNYSYFISIFEVTLTQNLTYVARYSPPGYFY